MVGEILFSVVTPVLNGRDFAFRYVKCLQSQVYTYWEAIIVDDGSDDETINYLHDLTHRDPRFRLFSNPLTKSIKGPYQARNYALSLARGDYICFLDIDDFWHPDRLVSLSHLIDDSEVRPLLSYSSYYRIDISRGHAKKRFSSWPISPKFLISFTNIVPMLTACVSADLLRNNNIHFLPIHHEDYIFWRTVFQSVSISHIVVDCNALAYYSVSSSSLSGNKFQALRWLLACYDHLGYNCYQKVLACTSRFIFELISQFRSFLSGNFVSESRSIPTIINLMKNS